MRGLVERVEGGAGAGLQEYSALLLDLQQHYTACRLELLGPSVRGAMAELVTVHTRDHTGLLRAGCAFLLHVCEDEHQLYGQFFSLAEDAVELGELLEQLCTVLYDNLRPLIIHISHLETLAELTSILRHEVVGQHCVQHPQLTAYRRLSSQLLADVQERLVYRATVYTRADILGYQPSPGDLAYPDKLEMMEKIAETLVTACTVLCCSLYCSV